MKTMILFAFLSVLVWECPGQLVRKVDYDAAFALQVGGDMGMLVPFGKQVKPAVRPMLGLKMTFPFNRKWFFGSELNYRWFEYESVYKAAGNNIWADFDLRQIEMPLYLKYMLHSNRASVLFGVYGTYVLDGNLQSIAKGGEGDVPEVGFSSGLTKWNAGITLGYEFRLAKHLNAMFRVNAGAKEVMLKKDAGWNKSLFPVEACLTLSYDFLRIGDCGCD